MQLEGIVFLNAQLPGWGDEWVKKVEREKHLMAVGCEGRKKQKGKI